MGILRHFMENDSLRRSNLSKIYFKILSSDLPTNPRDFDKFKRAFNCVVLPFLCTLLRNAAITLLTYY